MDLTVLLFSALLTRIFLFIFVVVELGLSLV